jgi:hypothetical protein
MQCFVANCLTDATAPLARRSACRLCNNTGFVSHARMCTRARVRTHEGDRRYGVGWHTAAHVLDALLIYQLAILIAEFIKESHKAAVDFLLNGLLLNGLAQVPPC